MAYSCGKSTHEIPSPSAIVRLKRAWNAGNVDLLYESPQSMQIVFDQKNPGGSPRDSC